MKNIKLLVGLLIISFGISLVSGCSVFRGQETMGQYVDGSNITATVKRLLVQDKDTSSANINVKTLAGIVQLSGFAKTEYEKERAGQIAASVNGVTEVHNNLIVREPK